MIYLHNVQCLASLHDTCMYTYCNRAHIIVSNNELFITEMSGVGVGGMMLEAWYDAGGFCLVHGQCG